MTKLSRREVVKLTAAAAVARAAQVGAQTPAPASYIGPLTGVTKGIEDRAFDPVAYSRDRYAAAPRQLRFTATARGEAETWQQALRAKVTELIGGFPSERQRPRPVTLETRTFPGYTREKIVFDTRAGVSMLVYLLVPAHANRPLPVMICIPGHGRGVDDIVGIDERGNDRTDKSGYQHDFAIQVAEAGVAALAIEPIGFGCRRDPINARQGLSRKACDPAAGGALLLGETMVAWRVWDVMRALDYIATRSELDASRSGCMGISGGGTITVFAAALDPRIRVALVSGYLNTFRDSIGSLAHCIDNYVPGVLNWAEMHDLAGLIAPRPLFVESGEKDNIFPIQASIESVNEVKKVYSVFGVPELVEHEVFPDGHLFWGKRGIPFIARHLRA